MPKYVSEYIPERELGAFLGQREKSALAQSIESSIPGTTEFAGSQRGKGRLEKIANVLGSAGGGSSSMALGKVVPVAALKEMTARALRSLPRGVREKLTKSKEVYQIEPEARNTAAYHAITGKIGVGPAAMADPEITVSSLAHELQHAADLGITIPLEHAAKRTEVGASAPFFMPYNEAAQAERKFTDLGYGLEGVPLEYRAVSADKQVGPIYRRGEGGPRLFKKLGGEDVPYPHLSEEATKRFVKLRREEGKTLEAARKERGVLRKARREGAVQSQGHEADVQKALRDFEAARIQRLVQ